MLSTCKIFLCLQEGKVCYTVDNEVSALARQTPGGRTPHMKGVGTLVVSLRGVNFGFWSHLGCSGQNAIIFSRDGSRLGLQAKKNIYCLCFTWSLLGVKKKLGPRPDRSVSFRGLIQNFRRAFPSLSYVKSLPPHPPWVNFL